MPTRKNYRTEVLRPAHVAAPDLHAIGAIDEATMRWFDETCLIREGRKDPGDARTADSEGADF